MSNNDLAAILEAEIQDPAIRYRVAHAVGLTKAMRTRDAVRFASMMLRAGTVRAVTREAIMTRFRVSRRTAYRIINQALNLRQNWPLKNVTTA